MSFCEKLIVYQKIETHFCFQLSPTTQLQQLTNQMPSNAKLARIAEQKAQRAREEQRLQYEKDLRERARNFVKKYFLPRVKELLDNHIGDGFDDEIGGRISELNKRILLTKLEAEAYPHFEENIENYMEEDADGDNRIAFDANMKTNGRSLGIYQADNDDYIFIIHLDDAEPDYSNPEKQHRALCRYADMRQKEQKHVCFTYNIIMRCVNWFGIRRMNDLMIILRKHHRSGFIVMPAESKQKVLINGKKYYTLGIRNTNREKFMNKQDPLATGAGIDFIGKMYFYVSKKNRDAVFDYVTDSIEVLD